MGEDVTKQYVKLKTEIIKLKEDIYDIRYALVIITIYIIVTQIIFGSVCVFWI